MSPLTRLVDPGSIAIAGLSSDPAKHGGRVLANLRRFGFRGRVWGVNPSLPEVEGVDVYASVGELPRPPDLVVAAVPAGAMMDVVESSVGVGAVIVFAAGFAESGAEGAVLQKELADAARLAGTRLLGPNSGGVIRPGRGLTASFLTCLERPSGEVRSGPVAVVTQSGGIGSYLHNLAAGQGGGLAITISTGNEADIRLAEALDVVAQLDEVRAVVAVMETVRDGVALIESVESAHARGKRVVACPIGSGDRGSQMMTSHTGAMAVSRGVLAGVLDSLSVVTAETPAEAYEVAGILARAPHAGGERAAVVTHSGGTALLLSDLAERAGVSLPLPGDGLAARIRPLLDHGVAGNPVDMGGIIGGPGRFAEVVGLVAGSGEYDAVMAVSTAHPPSHTAQRVATLLDLEPPVPVIQLWMAGDQGAEGLAALRAGDIAVTEEPRAAVLALAGLTFEPSSAGSPGHPIAGSPHLWGLPLETGTIATTREQAASAADELGYPTVVKAEASGLSHKTELGAVLLDLRSRDEVMSAFDVATAAARAAGWEVSGVRVQRYRPGLEMIVGGVIDESFGPLVSVGIGGTHTEVTRDVAFSPAPVDERRALKMIDRLRGRAVLDGYRGRPPADVAELARLVGIISRGVAGLGVREVEINPLIWDGAEWVAVDWLVVGD